MRKLRNATELNQSTSVVSTRGQIRAQGSNTVQCDLHYITIFQFSMVTTILQDSVIKRHFSFSHFTFES